MQVLQVGGRTRVDLVVGFEGTADLVLEFAVDGWVAEKVVSDAAECCRGCVTSCCSVKEVEFD